MSEINKTDKGPEFNPSRYSTKPVKKPFRPIRKRIFDGGIFEVGEEAGSIGVAKRGTGANGRRTIKVTGHA